MKDKSSVQYGMELEHYIAQKFIDLGFKNARRSVGSGNKNEAGDISGQDLFVAELKNRNTDSITIKEDVWNKLVAEVPLHSKRLPLYILRNKNKKTWAVLDVDDFFVILKGYLQNENNHC